MKTQLLRFKIKGIKNIDKDIAIDFSDETIINNKVSKVGKIKSIYGYNGAGKSAIISAMEIYKTINNNSFYTNNDFKFEIGSLINLKNRKAFLEVVFLCDDKNKKSNIYKHEIELITNHNKQFQIYSEKLSLLFGKTINGTYKTLFEVKRGVFRKTNEDYLEVVFDLLPPDYLKRNTLVSAFCTYYFSRSLDESYKTNLFYVLSSCCRFVDQLSILTSHDNCNYLYDDSNAYVHGINNLILKEKMKDFENNVNKLSYFIKIFKPELNKIIIDKKINKDFNSCSLVFDYKDYMVHFDYESSGIKRLVELYSHLKSYMNGGIVFIDEMDININSVYLIKLIEFLYEHGKGQLCFTTHNLEPMCILKNQPHSIDFLNVDKEIISWVKNGNYTPIGQYKNGMTKGSPFNVESFEFLGAFDY